MGKASRWFRSLLGLKKPDSSSTSSSAAATATTTFATASAQKPAKDKRRWSFVRSYRESISTKTDSGGNHTTFVEETVQSLSGHVDGVYPDQHAMTVAAATAAVAEAAVAAAQAAAAVVRLTSSGRGPVGIENREEWAAVKIQAAFRGCLARRALRALKGLVKLQALVRGHIDRKRTAEWLHRMQALIRAQARVRAGRAQAQAQIMHSSFLNAKSSNFHLYGPATPEKFESPIRSKSMKLDQSLSIKRNGSKSHVQIHGNQEKCWNRPDVRPEEQSWNQSRSSTRKSSVDDERSVRILEVDSGKQHLPKRRSLFHHSTSHPIVCDSYSQSLSSTRDSKTHQSGHSTSSCEVQSLYSPLKHDEVVESPFSPQHFSSSSSRDCGPKISPFTPTRGSDDSRSYLSGYSDNPSYMAYTESSKAKVRSLSAPKQRPPQYERSCSSSNMHLVQPSAELRLNAQRSFTSKAYPGSGRLDKFGMPVGYRC